MGQQIDRQKELELKKLEVEVKLQEIELQERQNLVNTKKKINQSILIAVIAGFIGILGTLFNSWFQHSNNRDIEKQKLNSSLILKSIETNDRIKSIETLKFLLSLNLIYDENNALKDILYDSVKSKNIPALFDKQSQITITDSLKTPLGDVDVFYNHIFIGKTNILGQVAVGFSLKELNDNEIEVKQNGIEFGYIDITVDRFDNILLRVIPKN